VLVSNTVLNLAHPNHMREALMSRRMGSGREVRGMKSQSNIRKHSWGAVGDHRLLLDGERPESPRARRAGRATV
jgi:hypothetical protein